MKKITNQKLHGLHTTHIYKSSWTCPAHNRTRIIVEKCVCFFLLGTNERQTSTFKSRDMRIHADYSYCLYFDVVIVVFVVVSFFSYVFNNHIHFIRIFQAFQSYYVANIHISAPLWKNLGKLYPPKISADDFCSFDSYHWIISL